MAAREFPVVKGTIRSAKGYLGAFELVVDDYAQPAPSSRAALSFGPARNGATSRCDIVLDISGGAPLFSAADLRDGYLRADPGDPAAVMRTVLKARDLTGTFDKPRYIDFTADICAHSRSKIVGCNRCLDLCPTGAIAPAGDHVAIDANICAGCGQCAACQACVPCRIDAERFVPDRSQRRCLGTTASQIRIAGPKNSAVYFDSSAQPTATPTANHHAPRSVSSSLARKKITKLAATSSGESGVMIVVPTDAMSVTLSRMVAVAATRVLSNNSPAERYTA